MGKPTIFMIIKRWMLNAISFVGWRLFLYGNQTTQEQYWQEIYHQEKFNIDFPNPIETYGKG